MKKAVVLFVLAAGISVAFIQQATVLLIPGVGIEKSYVTVGASTSTEIKTKYGASYREVKHYTEINGVKKHFSTERNYTKQGVSFYFKPNKDTVFCIKVRQPYKAKTEKGIVLGTSTMQEVKDAYGAADFYSDDQFMFLEYPGIKFYTSSAKTEADALKQKVTVISVVEFEK